MTDHYTYRVVWSAEDDAYVGTAAEWRGLSWIAETLDEAFRGIRALVAESVEDLKKDGKSVPQPLADRDYSGKFQVRVPPELHRELVMTAAEQNVSLNRLVSLRLAARQEHAATTPLPSVHDEAASTEWVDAIVAAIAAREDDSGEGSEPPQDPPGYGWPMDLHWPLAWMLHRHHHHGEVGPSTEEAKVSTRLGDVLVMFPRSGSPMRWLAVAPHHPAGHSSASRLQSPEPSSEV